VTSYSVSLIDGIVVESLGEELIVLVPGLTDIVRLEGDPANLLRRIMNGESPGSADSESISALEQLGVLRSSAIPRRSVLRAGAVATGAGIALLSFPAAAAASSTGPKGGADSLPAGEPGSTTPAVTPEDALVLYVDAMNPASYPGTGSTWFDLGPNDNDVFFPAETDQHPSYFEDTGVGGSGLSWFVFDGNDYFDITENASKKIANAAPFPGTNDPSTGYSVEAWVWDDSGGLVTATLFQGLIGTFSSRTGRCERVAMATMPTWWSRARSRRASGCMSRSPTTPVAGGQHSTLTVHRKDRKLLR
jgi:hypothetical protein